ncbi:ENTH domain-containing protein C794.11c isoform X2 [Daucus carota subsp. sativus]|uniref:ENTH domain-containing protein C794.11c isoform X2 n=1 Tax=Daucus carota subsp. sativus TaxID=79200 RepID=UPI0007EF0401|nr:PREDICTED: ENTH domain-containing protein C794.11c isoform X2 [Daucus carota subsp. sativus]
MSILGSSSSSNNGPIFQEFKKQASFFFKEKIKTARLALTDVTPAQLLTEEATNGSSSAPDTRTLKAISKAAFEVDDYFRILEILRSRLSKFDKKNWRTSYQALIVIEHLMTHGPESVAKVFQADKDVIRDMGCFQLIDEKGFNWGLNVRLKSEKILMLLEEGSLLKEERNRARKVSRGIEGFGSFSQRTSSAKGILSESPITKYARSKSQFTGNGDQEDWFSSKHGEETTKTMANGSCDSSDENACLVSNKEVKHMTLNNSFNSQPLANIETESVSKENVAPKKEYILGGFVERSTSVGDSEPLLDDENDESRINILVEEDHPFNDAAHLTGASLLSKDHTVQAF